MWSRIIFSRVSLSGRGANTLRSKRLNAAISNSHGIFVVAKTDTFYSMYFIPSIYLKNSVLILRSVSFSAPDRRLPKESISSMMMMEGECSMASSKSILSNFSDSPVNLEVMWAMETQKQVALQELHRACKSIVLPTPGGP